MSWRNVPFVKVVVLVAAIFLLRVPRVLAGDVEHAPDARPAARYQPAYSPVVRLVRLPVIVGVVVTMAPEPAKEPLRVGLRGPDGQVRRFPVEGGRAAIQYRQIVLRPGQSLTIQWVGAKQTNATTHHFRVRK